MKLLPSLLHCLLFVLHFQRGYSNVDRAISSNNTLVASDRIDMIHLQSPWNPKLFQSDQETIERVKNACFRVLNFALNFSEGLIDLMELRINAVRETFIKLPTVMRMLNMSSDVIHIYKYINTSLSITIDEALAEQNVVRRLMTDNDITKQEPTYGIALAVKGVTGTERRIQERFSVLRKDVQTTVKELHEHFD
ncbi:hypothetical protein SNE40_010313 [Patella caerulea]|uniref:Uncharacterized protein n=1 Tax=Patella caerulea TaxID=87958 RepID=A0AAN8K0S6_PATCE